MVDDRQADEVAEAIVGRLARRHSTAMVLLHHAVAERLGLGPTDHKCLDLLREKGPMSGSRLATLTGLTSGAVTGVVARLERAGYVSREADPEDGRRHILRVEPRRLPEVDEIFEPLRADLAELLVEFDARQLTAIAAFLTHATECSLERAGLLRVQARSGRASAEERR